MINNYSKKRAQQKFFSLFFCIAAITHTHLSYSMKKKDTIKRPTLKSVQEEEKKNSTAYGKVINELNKKISNDKDNENVYTLLLELKHAIADLKNDLDEGNKKIKEYEKLKNQSNH